MNNIVGTYLMFKANTVVEYIETIAEDMRKLSKIPKQLNKLIYKYYDLAILSDKKIDYQKLKIITGLDEQDENRLLLFYLLIEFDMASKTEYQDYELYEFYNFIVNSIIIFTTVENHKVVNKQPTYDDVINKILKLNLTIINDEYILLLDTANQNLAKVFNNSLRKERKFNELYHSSTYSIKYTKIKNALELYLEKMKYRSPKLEPESRKDIELISQEYELSINWINLEMTMMRVLRDTLSGIKRTIIISLDDDVITKKANLDSFINMIKLRFLKERMIFLVHTSLLEKYEDRINELITEGFNISYLKNSELTSYDVLKNGCYLFMEYEKYFEAKEKCQKHNIDVIINKANRKEQEKLEGIKYISS